MRECFQFEGVSVLSHGLTVHNTYLSLKEILTDGRPMGQNWRLPKWINHPLVLEFLDYVDDEVMELYHIYHDCGKPVCRIVDADGKQHFPNHAASSKARWIDHSDGSEMAKQVADLIGLDMEAHTLRPSGVSEFAARPQAIALLVTGLCELHANAQMFGGIESTGFKIKFKNLERLGGRVIDAIVAQR